MNRRNILQKLYIRLHKRNYASRLERQRKFPGTYVVSVGNLSTGGTGKTPAVELLAGRALEHKPLVILRGYGGKTPEAELMVSQGQGPLVSWREAGDEALLLAGLSGVRVAVGSRREDVISRFGADARLILLDDAFQNPSVYRDHELVLIDASRPLGKLKLLPTGRFREDLDALDRANTLLFTRTDLAAPGVLEEWRGAALEYLPPEAVFESIHKVAGITPPLPEGQPTGAFCGIGNSGAFFAAARRAGLQPEEEIPYPDHHPFYKKDLRRLLETNLHWVTTAKDEVRLLSRSELGPEFFKRLHILKIQLQINEGREAEFLKRVLPPK